MCASPFVFLDAIDKFIQKMLTCKDYDEKCPLEEACYEVARYAQLQRLKSAEELLVASCKLDEKELKQIDEVELMMWMS